jgi:hypothetical protein
MNKIKIICVGNGDSSYPGNFAKKERDLINKNTFGRVLHLFSGRSLIGDVRIDFSTKEATINDDVFNYLVNCEEKFETVILDPPYNDIFAKKYQKIGNTPNQFIVFANSKKTTELFNLIREKIDPSKIIIKSWNYYVPKGYEDIGSYLCYAGGYRKSTILMICNKK